MGSLDIKQLHDDVRLLPRFLRQGIVERDDHAKLLAELPDSADNMVVMDEDEFLKEAREAADRRRAREAADGPALPPGVPKATRTYEDVEYGDLKPMGS